MIASTGIDMCFYAYTDTTDSDTLSLHDALPICLSRASAHPGGDRLDPHHGAVRCARPTHAIPRRGGESGGGVDRKSTRLNSSHITISYAVFCLKKKKKNTCEPLALLIDVPATCE